MKRLPHSRRLTRFLLYTAAGAVIALAVLLSVVRLLVPSFEDYRVVVQGWASELLGQPVTVGGMDARLLGFSPSFELTDVAIISLATARPMIRAESLRIDLDLVSSLREGRLVLGGLVIDGADLAIERSDAGLRVVGQGKSDVVAGAQGDGQSFGRWLLSQPRLILRNSRIAWREPHGAVYPLEQIAIELDNAGERHRLNASVALPKALGTAITISLDMRGDILQPSRWEGRLFSRVEGLHAGRWLEAAGSTPVAVQAGVVDAAVWSEWRGGRLQEAEGEARARGLKLAAQQQAFAWDEIGGVFRFRTEREGWRVSLAEFDAVRGGHRWPAGRMEVAQHQQKTELAAQSLRIEELAVLAMLLPDLPAPQREWLAGLEPTGNLNGVRIERDPSGLRLQARFTDLGTAPWRQIPGVRGLDGELYADPAGAQLELVTLDAELASPEWFRGPLPLSRLAGLVLVQRDGEGWQLQGQRLVFANPDIEGDAELAVAFGADGSPFLDLRGRFRKGNGRSLPRYLPTKHMAEGAVRWLDRAFHAGQVTEGTLLFRGRTGDFPFRNNEGRFEARFRADGVDLAFLEEWPRLKRVAADVVFDGLSMDLESRGGTFLDSRIERCRVRIPSLGKGARLLVDGRVTGPAADLLRTVRETPLAKRVSPGALAGLSAQGSSALDLRLDIPLSRERPPLSIAGRLRLAGNRLQIGEGLAFEALEGTVDFRNTDVSAQGLKGRLLGAPVQLAVATAGNVTTISGQGEAEAAALRQSFDFLFEERLSGSAGWTARLVVPHRPAKGGGAALHIESSLEGLAVDLPPPFAKPNSRSEAFRLTRHLSGPRTGRWEMAYGPRFRAALATRRDGTLDRASLHFGTRMPDLPDSRRIRLTGTLAGVDPARWAEALNGGKRGGGGGTLPIEIAMYRLQLVPGEQKARRAGAGGGALVPLDVHVERLEWDDLPIGEVRFRAQPLPGKVALSEIGIVGKSFRLQGDGAWELRGAGQTHLDLKVTSANLGKMMADLGFVSVITDGKARAEGQLHWRGSPADFALERLGGALHLDIRDGNIDDVDPGSGRVLGLFSLNALPRRLRLDFSDLFRKGLGFKSIAGDLRFKQGDILTDNLAVDSPSAQVVMSGRTGLVLKDYDLLVTVVPNVSDSLAVAGGLALGPQAGAVIWVLQKLFRSEIDKATMFQYTVKGPWSAPVVERISRGE